MELLNIAEQMKVKINELERLKKELVRKATLKATSSAAYDKALAITIVKLRAGVEFELDGQIIKDVPASLIEKVAKGICYQEMISADTAEGCYKALVSNMSATEAQLNGWQSLNRHQSEA